MKNTIASERTRLGLSQTDLGEMLKKDRRAVSRIESNPMAIDGETLCALVGIFGCSADYLLGLSDERTPRVIA